MYFFLFLFSESISHNDEITTSDDILAPPKNTITTISNAELITKLKNMGKLSHAKMTRLASLFIGKAKQKCNDATTTCSSLFTHAVGNAAAIQYDNEVNEIYGYKTLEERLADNERRNRLYTNSISSLKASNNNNKSNTSQQFDASSTKQLFRDYKEYDREKERKEREEEEKEKRHLINKFVAPKPSNNNINNLMDINLHDHLKLNEMLTANNDSTNSTASRYQKAYKSFKLKLNANSSSSSSSSSSSMSSSSRRSSANVLPPQNGY